MTSSVQESVKDVMNVGETINVESDDNAGNGTGVGSSQVDSSQNDSESESEKEPPKKSQRKSSERKRASDTRKKVKSGTASPEDVSWLDSYDERQRGNARKQPPKPDSPEPSSDTQKQARHSSGNWRAKYGTVDGRELLCVTLASYWHGALMKMSKFIEENGGEPLLPEAPSIAKQSENEDFDWFASNLVLAVDELLPAHVVASPKLIAGVGTTALVVQATITAVQKKKAKEPAKKKLPAEEVKQAEEKMSGSPRDEVDPNLEVKKTKKERPTAKNGDPIV